MVIDLIIIATRCRLITEEVDGLKTLALQMSQAKSLIPALREDIDRDLASNAKLKAILVETLAKLLDQLRANSQLGIKLGKGQTLIVRAVTANGRDVDHAVAVLDEGATLHRNIQVSKVVQSELEELLILVLAQELDKALPTSVNTKILHIV